jgi:hypothetical protein
MDDATKRAIAGLAATAKSMGVGRLSIRVGDKGGVCVYGLGKFPVTLYWEQWERLLGISGEIQAFIETNKASLKSKADSIADRAAAAVAAESQS